MGDMEIIRPLGLAAIRCVAVAPRGDPTHYSRFTDAVVPINGDCTQGESLVERLLAFACEHPVDPILFYETDRDSLLISRNRERLGDAFRFAIPESTLVEDLLDKARFQRLAKALDLPVPSSRHLCPASTPPPSDLEFPVIVKPLIRHFDVWFPIAKNAKALRVDSIAAMEALWPQLAAAGLEVVAQQFVPGPESVVESYHVYVDQTGEIAGEFTGRKIRTYPIEYGHTTALETTNSLDVLSLGRELVATLNLRGVAKLDFKRSPDGRLHLLEVNPRFSLWHHVGALAGVNIPALVYADLAGLARPAGVQARPGVKWSRPWLDFLAVRASGIPTRQWVKSTLSSEAKSLISLDDPMPLLRGKIWMSLRRGLALLSTHLRNG
jgi:D-aspartate ligase